MARTVSCTPVLCVVLLAFSGPAAAQSPAAGTPTTRLIPYTAALPDRGPDAVNGARPITFALFDEADGGTLLWSETQTVDVDARGRCVAYLGAVTAMPIEIFRTEQARWLEVSVDGQALPRTMLVAVPYALRAADAETFGGKPLSAFVLTDGSGGRGRADGTAIDGATVDGTGVPNQIAKWSSTSALSSSILTESFDNRLGVLAPDPTGGGVVDSRVTIRNPDNNTAFGVLSPLNQRRFALNTFVNGAFQFFDGVGGTWNPGLMQSNARLGLGTITPNARITVVNAQNVDGLYVEQDAFRHAIRGHSPRSTIAILGMASDTFGELTGPAAGVLGYTDEDGANGVLAMGTGNLAALQAVNNNGPAGYFLGNVQVTGTLTKGGGAFEIDHPLDPANKYLRHSFVESPDMMNVYNGNATLDANGEAWIELPEWFEALNRDFRYQLTSIGGPAMPYVAAKVSNNRFKIGGGLPGGEVSWQITGIRQDAWANRHRIAVEEEKTGDDRGRYLHPRAHGVSPELALRSQQLNATLVRKQR